MKTKTESGNCLCIRVFQSIKLRLIVMSITWQASKAQREKGRQRSRARDRRRRRVNSKPLTIRFGIFACTFSNNFSRNTCIFISGGKIVYGYTNRFCGHPLIIDKFKEGWPRAFCRNKKKECQCKVFRYSFSEAIPIFFNRLKSGFFLVRSL